MRYPSIPAISNDSKTLTKAVQALKESMEIAQRLRGDPLDSFVRLRELQDLGLLRNAGGDAGVVVDPEDHGALTGLLDDDHTQYFNQARGDARYSQLGHTHAAGDITSGTFADARIAQSNVVQHEGALGTSSATASTIMRRDGSGYAYAVYFNQSSSNSENPTISQIMVTNGSDNFLRKASLAHLISQGALVQTSRTIATQHSLAGGGDLSSNRTLALVGDVASPGNSMYYGTNGTGVRGFYALSFANLTSKPTTLSGYGITDGVVTSRQIATANSLTGGGDLASNRTLTLVGDVAAPGANKFYGTDGSGVRGWYNQIAGVTDHGALTGLADDDHTQYFNQARGDARYSQLGHAHSAADITTGTLSDNLLSSNIPRLNAVNTFSQTAIFGKNGSRGYVTANGGSAANPGYFEFFTADDIRRGYIGWNGGDNRLEIHAENGWEWGFSGDVRASQFEAAQALVAQGPTHGWDGKGAFVDIDIVTGAGRFGTYDYATASWQPSILCGSEVSIHTNGVQRAVINNGGRASFSGKLESTGWDGGYANAPGLQLGVTGGSAHVHAYDASSGSYYPLTFSGSAYKFVVGAHLELQPGCGLMNGNGFRLYPGPPGDYAWFMRSGQSGAAALILADVNGTPRTWLYESAGQFGLLDGGGNWALRIDANQVQAAGGRDMRAEGYRWVRDGAYFIWNTDGYSYGSWRIGGYRGGYIGLMLDTPSAPTFMSSSAGSVGVYFQSSSSWCWFDDGGTFRVLRPVCTMEGAAYLHYGDTFTRGRVFVRNGGSPVGSQEGDITIIW